ncbi:MAG: hypothetical protein WCO08_07665 [Actinomycetes bacterium]
MHLSTQNHSTLLIAGGAVAIILFITLILLGRGRKSRTAAVKVSATSTMASPEIVEVSIIENSLVEDAAPALSVSVSQISIVNDPLRDLELSNAQIKPQSNFIAAPSIELFLNVLAREIAHRFSSESDPTFSAQINAILERTSVDHAPEMLDSPSPIVEKFQISQENLSAAKINHHSRAHTVLLGTKSAISRNVAQFPKVLQEIPQQSLESAIPTLYLAIDGLLYAAIEFI